MNLKINQMIREAAYYKWLSYDGCVDSLTCWLQAEEEILKLNPQNEFDGWASEMIEEITKDRDEF
jgi:hypothetical protein